MVCELMEAQDLQDVTLVGNDSGGGICQLLVIWGNEDKLFPLQFAQDLTREFPDARLVEVPGANVFLPLDAPARVAAEIAAFVRGDD